jgi:hypothetical protein
MDRKSEKLREIERLIRVSAAARGCLGNEVRVLKQRLNIPSRIRGSLKAHPSTWMAGSLLSGLAASLLFRRHPAPPPTKKHKGFGGVLFGLTLTAARPLAKVWLANRAKQWIAGLTASQTQHPPR